MSYYQFVSLYDCYVILSMFWTINFNFNFNFILTPRRHQGRNEENDPEAHRQPGGPLDYVAVHTRDQENA